MPRKRKIEREEREIEKDKEKAEGKRERERGGPYQFNMFRRVTGFIRDTGANGTRTPKLYLLSPPSTISCWGGLCAETF